MRIGECLIALGRPVESTEAFARSFERAPHSLIATLGIANLYTSHGEPRGALPFLARHLAHPLGLVSHHASSLRARFGSDAGPSSLRFDADGFDDDIVRAAARARKKREEVAALLTHALPPGPGPTSDLSP